MIRKSAPYLLLACLTLAACSKNSPSVNPGNSINLPEATPGALSGTAAIGAP